MRVCRAAVVAIALAPALTQGCGPTLGVRARLVDRVQGLHPCGGPYEVLQLTENAFEVRGCGTSVELTDVRPGGGRAFELMRPAAAIARQELGCGYDALTRRTDGPTERTFEGCGASATYHLFCADAGCHWQRFGDVVATSAPPSVSPAGEAAPFTPSEAVPLDEPIPPPPGAAPPAPEPGAT